MSLAIGVACYVIGNAFLIMGKCMALLNVELLIHEIMRIITFLYNKCHLGGMIYACINLC